jgi:hypothetical protein
VDAREHVDLLVLFVEQVLELAHFRLQEADSLLERLGVSAREGAPAELVARLALESDVGALGAAGADAVAAYFLGATAVACLGDAGLAVGADLDHLHGQNSRHGGGCYVACRPSRMCRVVFVQPRGECWKSGALATIRCSGSWVLVKSVVGRWKRVVPWCHSVARVERGRRAGACVKGPSEEGVRRDGCATAGGNVSSRRPRNALMVVPRGADCGVWQTPFILDAHARRCFFVHERPLAR